MIDYREAAASLDAHSSLLDRLCASCRQAVEAGDSAEADEASVAMFAQLQLACDEAFEFGQRIADGLLNHQGSFDDLVAFLRSRDGHRMAMERAGELLQAHQRWNFKQTG